MDGRSLNRLEPGDLIKRPNGLILEFVWVNQYVRSKPAYLSFNDLINGGTRVILTKLHVLESIIIPKDSKEYMAVKALFSKSQF